MYVNVFSLVNALLIKSEMVWVVVPRTMLL